MCSRKTISCSFNNFNVSTKGSYKTYKSKAMFISQVFILFQVYTRHWQKRFTHSFFRQIFTEYLWLHFINSKIHIFFIFPHRNCYILLNWVKQSFPLNLSFPLQCPLGYHCRVIALEQIWTCDPFPCFERANEFPLSVGKHGGRPSHVPGWPSQHRLFLPPAKLWECSSI